MQCNHSALIKGRDLNIELHFNLYNSIFCLIGFYLSTFELEVLRAGREMSGSFYCERLPAIKVQDGQVYHTFIDKWHVLILSLSPRDEFQISIISHIFLQFIRLNHTCVTVTLTIEDSTHRERVDPDKGQSCRNTWVVDPFCGDRAPDLGLATGLTLSAVR